MKDLEKQVNSEKLDVEAKVEQLIKDLEAKDKIVEKGESELQKLQESWSIINRTIMEKECELNRQKELYLQLQEEKHHAVYRYECERDKNLQLDKECEHLLHEIQGFKIKVRETSNENSHL